MSARRHLAVLLTLTAAGLSLGCSPLIGLVVRAAESGGGGDIRAGETRRGTTRAGHDAWTPACGAPNGGGDVAYTFVPEQTGTYRVDVNASYDCVAAIFDEERESVACNDDTGATSHSQVEARLEAGRTYHLVVDGYRGATGSFRLALSALALEEPLPPGTAEDALVLDQERSGDTRSGEDTRTPPCGSTPGSPDDTWTLTPPEDGRYRIDVTSDYDATLAMYLPGASEPLACNDDEQTTRASRVEVQLSAGVPYQVVVDGYHGATGTYRVRATRIGGAGASQVLPPNTPTRGDTRGQADTRTPGCGSHAGSPDQTWRFTPTRTGPVEIHVDSEYDAVLAIYEDGAATPIQCNDDYQGTRTSRLTERLEAGRTYEIVVDGYAGGSGAYMIRATEIASSGGGPLALGATVQGNTVGGVDQRTPTCGASPGSPEETWIFVAPEAGMYAFQVDADYDSVLALYLNGQALACNDDHGSTRASRVEASLPAGQRVEVVVDGFHGQTGSYRLQATRMRPAPLPPAPATVENIGAMERRCGGAPALIEGQLTAQVGPAAADARTSCAGGAGGGEALYTVQVSVPTVLHVTAEGAPGPVLELRSGCSRGHAVLACDGSAPQAALHARLEPGRTYTLLVDSRAAAEGEITLQTRFETLP